MTEIAIDDALFGEILSPRVQQIIRLERQADDAQWEAARLIAEELAEGKSQRQLGREIGKSDMHVMFMRRSWECKPRFAPVVSFNEVYHSPEVRGIRQPELPTSEPPDTEQPPLPEPEPERVLPPCEVCGEPNPDHFEFTICPDCVTERSAYQAEPEPAPNSEQPPPDVQAARLARMRQMANELERENPADPIRELLDLQGALQRAIPKMRALKEARQVVAADALTARVARLCKEMEELL